MGSNKPKNILKNVWKQYKSGSIPLTVPWTWKKTGIKKMGESLKAINKNKK